VSNQLSSGKGSRQGIRRDQSKSDCRTGLHHPHEAEGGKNTPAVSAVFMICTCNPVLLTWAQNLSIRYVVYRADRYENANFRLGSLPGPPRSVSVPSAARGPAHTYTPFQPGCYSRLPCGYSDFKELALSAAAIVDIRRRVFPDLTINALVFSSSRSMCAKHFMVVCSASR